MDIFGGFGLRALIHPTNKKSVDNKVVSYLSQMQKQDNDPRELNVTTAETYSTF